MVLRLAILHRFYCIYMQTGSVSGPCTASIDALGTTPGQVENMWWIISLGICPHSFWDAQTSCDNTGICCAPSILKHPKLATYKGFGLASHGSALTPCFLRKLTATHTTTVQQHNRYTGVDPGFLERGFICIKVWGFALLIYLIFLKYPMKMK